MGTISNLSDLNVNNIYNDFQCYKQYTLPFIFPNTETTLFQTNITSQEISYLQDVTTVTHDILL
jgi:hypothetical protein